MITRLILWTVVSRIRKPLVPLAIDARELVLPRRQLWDNHHLLRRKSVHDVARPEFGRAQIQCKFTLVGEVMVLTALSLHLARRGSRAEAAKSQQVFKAC